MELINKHISQPKIEIRNHKLKPKRNQSSSLSNSISSKNRSTFCATLLHPDIEKSCVSEGQNVSSSVTFRARDSFSSRVRDSSRLSNSLNTQVLTCLLSMGRNGTKASTRFFSIILECCSPPTSLNAPAAMRGSKS